MTIRKLLLRYPNTSTRAIEIFIPALSWILITMPIWLSFWHPAVVAYFVITFDVYWFYKSFLLAYHAMRSFLTMQAHIKVPWLEKARALRGFNTLYHAIIIPEFKEPIHVLRETLTNLKQQDFPHSRLIIVLATEATDTEATETSASIQREFGRDFGKLIVTRHTLGAGEVSGKSSNMAYAGRQLAQQLEKWQIPISDVTVTSCDADSLLHPKYLSYISYRLLSNLPGSNYWFFQGAILFYSNIWRIPLPNRMLNTISSIFNLSLLSQARLINFSTYTAKLETIASAGYWGKDVIPEDYHLFFKSYFRFGTRVRTVPVFLPILSDAAESTGFFRTLVNQYEQYKRWAWGISDIPFVVKNYFLHPEIPFIDRTYKVITLLEQHILWPTNWFILTLGSSLPPLINPAFARTVLGHNLSQISSGILTMSAVFLLAILIIDWRIRPPKPKDFGMWKIPFLYLQWLTLPVVSFFLSALPGLDAHTRMLLGKRLKYRVTEKV